MIDVNHSTSCPSPEYICAILAGGEGKRLGGLDKSALMAGDCTFLERIAGELRRLRKPCVISAGAFPDIHSADCRVIMDLPAEGSSGQIGPLGGMLSCLEETGAERIFFVPCDMPDFRAEAALILEENAGDDGWDCLLWQTRDGRIQTCCGFYKNTCLPAMKEAARSGNYRLRDLLKRLDCRIVRTQDAHIPDGWFRNINDPEDCREYLEAGQQPAVFTVSGKKNTGKTRILERILHELSARGLRVAVIKHDGHDFEPDVPGTDSYRLKKAGAYGTVIFSGERYCVVKDEKDRRAEDFLAFFPEADLILLEGHKGSPYQKIEMLRTGISEAPVCDPGTVLAYAADWIPPGSSDSINGKPAVSCEDMDYLLEMLMAVIDGRTAPAV